jgi:uracil-DNA glycosylase
MAGRRRVLSAANGPLTAPVLFVAEAPGRLGGDRTGVPLTSDQTGRNFGELLESAVLPRSEIFVTNAVLCNPRDGRGLNARPTTAEVQNCSDHLDRLISILDPPWVVTLGQVALDALQRLERHEVVLARDVATAIRWYSRSLVPLYHPGPRSVARRGRQQHHEDYARLGALLRGREGT